MSKEYDEYLNQHRGNVYVGFQWLVKYAPEAFLDQEQMNTCEYNIHRAHDRSKDSTAEYDAYDKYFYGGNRSYEVVENFNKAWLHHIHTNPHHWQHWILLEDDPKHKDTFKTLEMPFEYVIEMVCDWWAFSWTKGNLYEIFKWYDEHKDTMKLHPDTREQVEGVLDIIKVHLNELKAAGHEAGELAAYGA